MLSVIPPIVALGKADHLTDVGTPPRVAAAAAVELLVVNPVDPSGVSGPGGVVAEVQAAGGVEGVFGAAGAH